MCDTIYTHFQSITDNVWFTFCTLFFTSDVFTRPQRVYLSKWQADGSLHKATWRYSDTVVRHEQNWENCANDNCVCVCVEGWWLWGGWDQGYIRPASIYEICLSFLPSWSLHMGPKLSVCPSRCQWQRFVSSLVLPCTCFLFRRVLCSPRRGWFLCAGVHS